MRIGIDASNISKGGGLTHLFEILKYLDGSKENISAVHVWSNRATLDKIVDHELILKMHLPVLDKSIFYRTLWQKFKLPFLLKENACDIVFVPGGPTSTSFSPKVTMSRNMHPFVNRELFRLPLFSFMMLKYIIIRLTQPRLFKKYEGIVFLNKFAENAMMPIIGKCNAMIRIIPHGVNPIFKASPRSQKPLSSYSAARKFQLLYVSKIDLHKHQSEVAQAVLNLHHKGYPVHITFVGPVDSQKEYSLFNKVIVSYPSSHEVISYTGNIDYNNLKEFYKKADLFVFASSCENMPNILLEAMAAGLPIACSSFGPMPQILKEGGVYFSPESNKEIENSIQKLLLSEDLRKRISHTAYEISQAYTWKKCSEETFQFIHDINKKNTDGLYQK